MLCILQACVGVWEIIFPTSNTATIQRTDANLYSVALVAQSHVRAGNCTTCRANQSQIPGGVLYPDHAAKISLLVHFPAVARGQARTTALWKEERLVSKAVASGWVDE